MLGVCTYTLVSRHGPRVSLDAACDFVRVCVWVGSLANDFVLRERPVASPGK